MTDTELLEKLENLKPLVYDGLRFKDSKQFYKIAVETGSKLQQAAKVYEAIEDKSTQEADTIHKILLELTEIVARDYFGIEMKNND